jgi:hypothetical protein
MNTIRARYAPDDAVVITPISQTTYRFAMYYLPDYTVLRLGSRPNQAGTFVARGRQDESWDSHACLFAGGVHHVIWVLDREKVDELIPAEAESITTTTSSSNLMRAWHMPLTASEAGRSGYPLGDC